MDGYFVMCYQTWEMESREASWMPHTCTALYSLVGCCVSQQIWAQQSHIGPSGPAWGLYIWRCPGRLWVVHIPHLGNRANMRAVHVGVSWMPLIQCMYQIWISRKWSWWMHARNMEMWVRMHIWCMDGWILLPNIRCVLHRGVLDAFYLAWSGESGYNMSWQEDRAFQASIVLVHVRFTGRLWC